MSRYRWLSIALITAAVISCGRLPCAFAVINLGVVPTPRDVEPQDGSFTVDASTPLVLSPQATEGERFAAERLRDSLRELFNLPLAIQSDAESAASAKSIVIGKPDAFPEVASRMKKYGLTLSEKMRKEGYVLGVGNDGVVIGALSDAGVLYGTMTLRQMIQAREAAMPLPGVKIHDWPYLGMRGIQDEISYGQVSTMENFKDIIRFLALYKMNTMFVYIEDMFQFKKYPTIGVGRGALSKEQVDELEAFAKPYNVQIIPIFEMLGNQGALLMLDEVRPFAEYPGAHSFATNDAAFEFLTNCFEELIEAFDSKYFHAGLDESWDLGYGKTEEAVKRDGRGPVHAAHYRRLNELLKGRGKTMIMYADIILTRPEILKLIPKDIILMDWQYDPAEHYPTLDTLAKYDFPLMV
ncbi:MAG: beta-N-acetylhexosaminidase, partial [Planctomycetaceae bacterium]